MIKDEELSSLLCEILTEIKDIKKDNQLLFEAMSIVLKHSDEIEGSLELLQKKTPSVNLNPLTELVSYSHREILKEIKNQQKDIIHEKRILLYPEGEGKNLLKDIVIYTIKATAIVLSLYLFLSLSIDYFQQRNKSEKYKYSYIWIYWNGDKDTRKYLNSVFKDFHNDSIYTLRKHQIDSLIVNR